MNNRVRNCYRALLAQINYLDNIYPEKHRLKELYEETSVLAYYIMENDRKSIQLNIQELIEIIKELLVNNNCANQAKITYICGEIETHLKFLTLEFG